ncbi:MAG: hypothetical protein KHY44_14925 [Clostridiales bacterium]|jgi:Mlc titration factor MtfA (ptsG expression regulator)|nr:hypothetical protein [Clostridiales bacterium]
MRELRGMNDFYKQYKELKQLPIDVQEEIRQSLAILDESYGEPDNRVLEGGKVLLIEDEIDAEKVNNDYDLSMHEFADELDTINGIYLIILLIWGSENNIMIIGKKESLQSYL